MLKERTKINAFTYVVVFLPILSIYASGIPGLSFGDLSLAIVFLYYVYCFFQGKNSNVKINDTASPIWLLIITIIVLTLIDLLIVNEVNFRDVAIRVTRRAFYYCTAALFATRFFQYENGAKLFVKVGLGASFYLIIQYILYYGAGFVLKGFISFFSVYHENYATVDYNALFAKNYRPTSFFLEPAHMSRYMCIPLIITLFESRISFPNRICIAIFFSIAIAMTTSGTGIICVGLIWMLYLFNMMRQTFKKGKLKKRYMIALAIIPVALYVILNNSTVQYTLFRINNSDLTNVNTAGGARFRGYIQYFKLPLINKILGMGYGSTPNTELVTWFSGASYILYGCGIIGAVVCVIMFVKIFFRLNNITGRVAMFIWVILFFMDDAFMSHVAVVYFCFIAASNYITSIQKGSVVNR